MPSSINDPRHWLATVPATLQASPLYSHLWEHLKEDAALLELMALVDTNQPLPITFFTAVNYLILAEPQDPLARFYPFLQPEGAQAAAEAYPFFRAFVLDHQEALQALLPTARLQTNEVTRCANLLPAFLLAYQRGGYQALNMLEIGSSAGLNLLWDHYHYRYGRGSTKEEIRVGDPLSLVEIPCELAFSQAFPFVPGTSLPRVASCQGIELCPRDLDNEQDMRWVRAAIWPEEIKRHRTLDAALMLAQYTVPLVHKGDACDLLPALLAAIPASQTAVVWHSYAVNQGPVEVKQRIEEQIAAESHRIPVYRVALEVSPPAIVLPRLELYEYRNGQMVKQELLAQCALHGEHMTWLADLHTF
jgi:hypothetical protein